jgi:hypothetical protein
MKTVFAKRNRPFTGDPASSRAETLSFDADAESAIPAG